MNQPANAHGKICYIQMPALDIEQSAEFYRTVFDWTTRTHGDGTLAFDDTTGQVSGMWQTDLKAADDPGMIVSIMVRNADEAADRITAAGGTIETRPEQSVGEAFGTFRDPAGNLLFFYPDPSFG